MEILKYIGRIKMPQIQSTRPSFQVTITSHKMKKVKQWRSLPDDFCTINVARQSATKPKKVGVSSMKNREL